MNQKLLFAFLAGLLVIKCAYCAESNIIKLIGLPVTPTDSPSDTQADQQQDRARCDTGALFGCKNCTSRMICDSSQQIISVIGCEKDTPFCNENVCTADLPPPSSCPQPISPFCPTAGTFPSVTSCTRYVICDSNNKATEYQCPSNLVFDPVSGFCKRRALATDCPIINCAFNRNKFIVYPLKKQIYFFCGASNNDIRVLQCLNDNEEFNPTTIICEKKCTAIGFLAAPDRSKYYLCVQIGEGIYEKYLQSCPSGTKFQSTTNSCVVPSA